MTADTYAEYASRVVRSDVPQAERGVCVRWAAARHLMDESEREVEVYFMGLLKTALEAKDFKEAEALIRRCPPDTVTRVFMVDQLQQARRKP